jgi:hypothetical protein
VLFAMYGRTRKDRENADAAIEKPGPLPSNILCNKRIIENPKSPVTIDGSPAKISVDTLKNLYVFLFAYSLKKIPVPVPAGIAMSMDVIIMRKVPTAAGKSPSNTGSLRSIAFIGLAFPNMDDFEKGLSALIKSQHIKETRTDE